MTFASPALAAEGSIGLTPGSGTNAALTAADGAGFVSFLHGLCGGAAATMGTACANQAIINSSGQILTLNSQSGTWNITNISGTISLPTGASTSALQTTGNTALTTINTTLGSPFQAGGSIGNTSFAATQGTAANLNATVVGTGTFSTQLTGATNNINNIAGTVSLPTGASTSALQTTGNTSLSTIATNTTQVSITPTDCSVSATGSAQTVITSASNLHKFSIASIDPVTGSGVPFWISFTGAAVAAAIGSYPIAAPTATTYAGMGSYTDIAPAGTVINENVSVIAPSGYKISCTRW